MVTASPPVSPRVVANILMIQKPSVTSGTLLGVVAWASFIGILAGERPASRGAAQAVVDIRTQSLGSRLGVGFQNAFESWHRPRSAVPKCEWRRLPAQRSAW